MKDLTKEAYDKAVEVLEKCATPHGFYAAFPGYQGVWARDSMITLLGASLLGEKFKKACSSSIEILGEKQSEKGQVPNAVLFDRSPPQVDFKSIDSSLWFIIGNYIFRDRYKDGSIFDSNKSKIEKAFTWLSYQDFSENGMLAQLPTTDWQDAFPHRYGHTINTQALYYGVLNLMGKSEEALRLKEIIDNNKDDALWNGEFYLPWRWKNHNKYHEVGDWFDSLGNLLAIVFELADKERSEKILNYVEKKKINEPYPMKAISPPIKKGTPDWQEYFEDALCRTPNHYLNGGIWTYIGGFYVLALIKTGKLDEAGKQLEKLAEANMQKPYFSEWLNGVSGKPGLSGHGDLGGNQCWNAGMYVLAYESMKKGKVLI